MSPIVVDKEQKREHLLHAALAMFKKKPFDKVTVEDIAGEAGVSKGVVYLYFKSKDELYMALLEHVFTELFEEFATHPEIDDPVEQIEHVLLEGLEPWEQETEFMRFFIFYWGKNTGTKTDLAIQKKLRNSFRHNREHIEEIYLRGVESGVFKEFDPKHVSTVVMAISEFIPMQWILDPGAFSLKDAGKEALDIFLKGIIKD